MKKTSSRGKSLLIRCPACGGKLTLSSLYQYSIDYDITKTGKLSKKCRKRDVGSMECSNVCCENGDFYTDFEFEVQEPPEYRGRRVYYDATEDVLHVDLEDEEG